jgi:ankyrin repeat protein
VKVLAEAGADLQIPLKDGRAPGFLAAQNGHGNVLRELGRAGVRLDTPGPGGITPWEAGDGRKHPDVIVALVELGYHAPPRKHVYDNAGDDDDPVPGLLKAGASPIFIAAATGNLAEVQRHVLAGEDVNRGLRGDSGVTPFTLACEYGHTAVVAFAIASGARLDTAKGGGYTPLYTASRKGYTEVVRLLVEHGADLEVRQIQGCTPLHVACERGHLHIVRVLVLAGANVNATREDTITPMWLAAQEGHTEIARMMIEHGANAHVHGGPKVLGMTPMHAAAGGGHIAFVEMLLELGANVDEPRTDGVTPIFCACDQGHVEMVRWLLAHGASATTKAGDFDPMLAAARGGHLEICNVLLAAGAKFPGRGSK